MHLVVVDPRLLMEAFENLESRSAKLLTLFLFGNVSIDARGHLLEEVDELREDLERWAKIVGISYGEVDYSQLERVQERAEQGTDLAGRRKRRMEEAFEQYVPDWLLLVTSPPLLEELMDLAQRAQTRGLQQVQPHRISRLLARCTAKSPRDFKLDEDVHYTGAERRAAREYLIHTAVVGQAESLITEDEELNLPGNLSFSDPKTRQSVRPYTLDEFVVEVLPHILDLDAIDAPAVFRAAVEPL